MLPTLRAKPACCALEGCRRVAGVAVRIQDRGGYRITPPLVTASGDTVQASNHHIGNPHVVHAYLSPDRLERDVAENFVRLPKRPHRERKVTRQEQSPINRPQPSYFCHICTSAAVRMQEWCQ